MHILMVGTGGIGAYYGARLQHAGHKVVFVARGMHLKAIQEQGLKVTHPTLQFHQQVTICDEVELHQTYPAHEFDLIILTIKAGATAQWRNSWKNWLTATDTKTPILSLQNGVDNERLIAEVVGRERTIGGLAVRIGGHIVSPAVVEATGIAQIVMGYWPNHSQNPPPAALTHWQTDFQTAGIPTFVTADIQYELWRKLLINNGVNPLSALTRLDTRTLTSHPTYGHTVYQLMQETAQAARADGVAMSQGDVDEMFNLIKSFDAIKTSMLVDREQGRPLELAAISGAVLERHQRLGTQAPVTALVSALLEQGL
ncbi:MAG: 2-dehydropantoate 2-reductase [Thiofilum sp.]|uniref:ketopantoate reductase family protein n=1 Tax=Thiofilum sp. TaxID=2212733 RepID=UPI0025EE3E60|nr:2-dehydropantoate 2-reductase [Thiofilum sp.]MBK8454699.1 2-dehydropantoate 2-reductase [Thiofilum sp.]